jgi:hypothetical protein
MNQRRRESQYVDTNRRRESQHVDTKGGNNNFYNKLRKPGLELETLGSDTMLDEEQLTLSGGQRPHI